MESKGTKRLLENHFTQILQLPYEGLFKAPSSNQVLYMMNEMGYNPPLSFISGFKKFGLPIMWNFFIGVTLRCFTGMSCGLDKAKLQFYYVTDSLYYGLKVEYAYLLWDEFTNHVKHSKKSTKISSAQLWSLILCEAYNQKIIMIPKGAKVA